MTWSPPKDALWWPKAKREMLPNKCLAGLWVDRPLGVIEHYTVGHNDPFNTLVSRGLGVVAFVARSGQVTQYANTAHWEWHARDASSRYFGVEHEALDAGDLTLAQMEASAEFTAWLWGTVMGRPASDLVRSKGVAYTVGLKVHNDGLEDGGVKWDSAIHWNGIWKCDVSWVVGSMRSSLNAALWTAAQYLDKVKSHLGTEDDMTPEEHNATMRRWWSDAHEADEYFGTGHRPADPEADDGSDKASAHKGWIEKLVAERVKRQETTAADVAAIKAAVAP